MFYKTDYNSPVGNITLGADGEHIVGLWIKGQKYFADTVKEKMFQNDDLPVFQKAKNWLDRYFRGENRKFPNCRWLRRAGSSGRWFGRFFVKFLRVRCGPTAG